MKVLASKDALRDEVADVPENWLKGFALKHPLDIRKFAAKRNGTLLYRVSAVVDAIETGEAMPNGGLVARGDDAPWMKDREGASDGAGRGDACETETETRRTPSDAELKAIADKHRRRVA